MYGGDDEDVIMVIMEIVTEKKTQQYMWTSNISHPFLASVRLTSLHKGQVTLTDYIWSISGCYTKDK